MKKCPRLALIHATRLAIDPVESAANQLWPEAETISILEEGLAVDRKKSKKITPALVERITELARYAERIDSDGILFTCSSFGQAIDMAANGSSIPVMRPNEAMFDAAFSYGSRIAMIFTFPSAASEIDDEFNEEASVRQSDATLNSYFCDKAFDAKSRGDGATHDSLIVSLATGIKNTDVILLAQFSMASAAEEIRRSINIPVLTSPESAILKMRHRIEHG